MMFSCCHPALTDDGRTALILRLVCGFGTDEVACAFLADPAAMAKRLTRAKRIIADDGQLFEVSTPEQARERMPAVLTALYLMFDAGYHGSVVPEPVRAELCADAIRLATLLAASPATATAEVDALLALMYLHAARMPARLDAAGALVPLEHQDRSLWDGNLIARGMEHLGASARGGDLTTYHLEAGIAAVHAMSPSVEATPWPKIADLYDRLYKRKPTPVVALGRAIARSQVDGPARGIDALLALPRSRAPRGLPPPSTGPPSATSLYVSATADAPSTGFGAARRPRETTRSGRCLREGSWSVWIRGETRLPLFRWRSPQPAVPVNHM